jgi:molecular chaperone DnaK
MCGLVSPDPPLPYNIGIAKYFDDKEKDLFYPVKGLEKNRQFPAIGLFRIKTDKVLRKGEKGDCIFIPIYQGDYNATGTELSLYNLVCEVIITGKNLPDTLSEGSPVDITIEIDQSQQMYFSAFFPSLNYSEKLKIEINQLSVPSATNAVRQIANTRKEAERTEIDKLVQKQQIIAEKTQKLIEVIKSSLYELTQLLQDLRREDDFLEYCEANFNVFNWNNPTEARRLINKGLRLANSNQYDEVNLIIAQIKMLIITIPGGGDKS